MTFDFNSAIDLGNRIEILYVPENPEPDCEYAVQIYSDEIRAIIEQSNGIKKPHEISIEEENFMWEEMGKWVQEVLSKWVSIQPIPDVSQWEQSKLKDFFELVRVINRQKKRKS